MTPNPKLLKARIESLRQKPNELLAAQAVLGMVRELLAEKKGGK